jgi:2-phosphosulfolactate phosphatase
MALKIDVVLSVGEVEFAEGEFRLDFSGRLAIVVDVLRATTTITTALANNAHLVIPARDIAQAFELFAQYPQALLCGERNGLIVDGFHLGNSPRDYTAERISGHTLIFSTTNGTRALNLAKGAKLLLLACFNNVSAVAQKALGNLRNIPEEEIIMLCSGKLGRFCIEDAVCCGCLTANLVACCKQISKDIELTEGAKTAVELYNMHKNDLLSLLISCQHGHYLTTLGLLPDLEYASKVNSISTVPVFFNGNISLL